MPSLPAVVLHAPLQITTTMSTILAAISCCTWVTWFLLSVVLMPDWLTELRFYVPLQHNTGQFGETFFRANLLALYWLNWT